MRIIKRRDVIWSIAGLCGFSGCIGNDDDPGQEVSPEPTQADTPIQTPTETPTETPTATPTPTPTRVPPDDENATVEFDQSEPIELTAGQSFTLKATTNIEAGESISCRISSDDDSTPFLITPTGTVAEDGSVEWEVNLENVPKDADVEIQVRAVDKTVSGVTV